MGYTERLQGLLLEEDTVQLASFFIRCVLNHAQSVDKQQPFLEFRSHRLTYSYQLGGPREVQVHAVDDGGIQVFSSKASIGTQVALLEGKRTFHKITNGKPAVTDELLGQMAGEALALQQNSPRTKKGNRRTDFITILGATKCLRLFHFHIPVNYIDSYKDIANPGLGSLRGVIRVSSTEWLDVGLRDHREILVSHLLALIRWANEELE